MSLVEPILPPLRGILSHTLRSPTRSSTSIPLSSVSSIYRNNLKRKITALEPQSCVAIRSLSTSTRCFAAASPGSNDPPSMPLRERIARAVMATLPASTTEQYYSYRKAEDLWKECKLQGEYAPEEEITGKAKFWYEDCGLVPCLRNWSAISNLHVWLIMVRFRGISERARAKMWQQQLVNHYFFDLEELLTNRHKVTAKSLQQKYLKQLFEQFRYSILSYDEAFIRGDAQMAAAIWANVFLMREDMDMKRLAMVVSYVRRILSGLEKLDEEAILSAGVYFGNPADELPLVEKISKNTKP